MRPGQRVVVSAFAADPLQAIERGMALEPQPWPIGLTARDVVVEVRSASVGWVDLLMSAGLYQHLPQPPYVPGLESAGVVAWAGAEARAAVGDRVLVDGFLAGPRSLGAYRDSGGFASWVVAPDEAILPVPSGFTFDQAATLLGSYETAYHCLVTRGRLRPGETVLVHGASGATGLAAVQIAKILGATVIATGRSAEKLAVVKEQGADHVLPSHGFRDAVRDIGGVDVVYDGVGGDVSLETLRCVAFGARYLVVGWAATPFAGKSPNQLPTNLILMKGLDVLGCPMVIATVRDPSLRAPRLAQVLAWAESGQIRPYVSHAFPLAEFRAALRARWTGEVIGGCVVNPRPENGRVEVSRGGGP